MCLRFTMDWDLYFSPPHTYPTPLKTQCWFFPLSVISAKRITPLVCNPGRIMLTSSRLYFQPFNNADPVSSSSCSLQQCCFTLNMVHIGNILSEYLNERLSSRTTTTITNQITNSKTLLSLTSAILDFLSDLDIWLLLKSKFCLLSVPSCEMQII